MRQGTITTVHPEDLALTLAEGKRQLRIEPDENDEDVHITHLCRAAQAKLRRDLQYPILRETLQTRLSCFPTGPVWLAGGDNPVINSVSYEDLQGQTQTLPGEDYRLDAVQRRPRLWPAPHKSWPSTISAVNAVLITWQAGWSTPDEVPPDLKMAMQLLVGHWDQNREAVVIGKVSNDVQMTYESLLEGWHLSSFG
ncbi:MAG: head-tail connector protein [Pseudomonadota bacterium]